MPLSQKKICSKCPVLIYTIIADLDEESDDLLDDFDAPIASIVNQHSVALSSHSDDDWTDDSHYEDSDASDTELIEIDLANAGQFFLNALIVLNLLLVSQVWQVLGTILALIIRYRLHYRRHFTQIWTTPFQN